MLHKQKGSISDRDVGINIRSACLSIADGFKKKGENILSSRELGNIIYAACLSIADTMDRRWIISDKYRRSDSSDTTNV